MFCILFPTANCTEKTSCYNINSTLLPIRTVATEVKAMYMYFGGVVYVTQVILDPNVFNKHNFVWGPR